MQSIRKRVPFQSAEEDVSNKEDDRILDEQEQEATLQALKDANHSSNVRCQTALQLILALSFVLQMVSLFHNPLLVAFPSSIPDITPEIPLPIPFTLWNIFLHFNLATIVFSDELRSLNIFSETALHPLPYQLTYAIAAVTPTLSMFLRKSWQSTAWWSVTMLMVFTVQTVTYAISEGNESISELEALRYISPSA